MQKNKPPEPGFLTFRRNIKIMNDAEARVAKLEEQLDSGRLSRPSKKIRAEIDDVNQLSRRAALKTMGGAVGLLAAVAVGIKTTVNGLEDESEDKKKNVQAILPIQKPEGLTATYPGMTILEDEKVVYKKPPNLELDNQTFLRISQSLGKTVRELVETTTSQPTDGSNGQQLEDLKRIAKQISDAHPQMAVEWENFYTTWDQSTVGFYKHLNKYLMPGGHMLDAETEGGEKVQLRLRTIADSKHLQLKSPAGNYKIPVLEVTGGGGSKPVFGGHLGVFDHNIAAIVMHPDRIRKFLNGVLKQIPKYPNFKKPFDLEDLHDKAVREYLYHEAIHAYLFKRFPGISNNSEILHRIMRGMKLTLDIDGDKKVDLSGDYSPLMFHEVCAFGGQLMHTEMELPLNHGVFLQDASDFPPDHNYHLLYKMLPYATMKKAPDCDIKRQMLEIFKKTGKVHSGDAVGLIGFPPYSNQHSRLTGRQLFAVGYNALQTLEQMYQDDRK